MQIRIHMRIHNLLPSIRQPKRKSHDEVRKDAKNQGGERMTKTDPSLFPKESVINKYGFLYLSKEVLVALGFQKGDKVILRQTPEGLLISKGV
jgi:hypothetical protein